MAEIHDKMSQFLQDNYYDDDNNNDNAKVTAIPQVFSENSCAKKTNPW